MRAFSRTNQFKKDVKLAGRRGKDLARLKAVLDCLIAGEPLPPQFKDHPLRGNFAEAATAISSRIGSSSTP